MVKNIQCAQELAAFSNIWLIIGMMCWKIFQHYGHRVSFWNQAVQSVGLANFSSVEKKSNFEKPINHNNDLGHGNDIYMIGRSYKNGTFDWITSGHVTLRINVITFDVETGKFRNIVNRVPWISRDKNIKKKNATAKRRWTEIWIL